MKKYYSYRVNKYISQLPGNNEWISFYDIGSSVTQEDYLYTENEFIKLFMDVSTYSGAYPFTFRQLIRV